MNFLIACTECARHVHASDPICPFCGEALPASLRSRPPRLPTERLGRAATLAFGAALAASTAVGCGSGTETDAGAADSGTTADAGLSDAGTDAGYDGGSVVAPYGTPADAGTDAGSAPDAGGEPDAGRDAGAIVPPYGTPPEDAGFAPLYGAAPEPPEE